MDLAVALDSGAGQPVEGEYATLTVSAVEPHAEEPLVPRRGEVFVLPPGWGFLGVRKASDPMTQRVWRLLP